MGASIELEQIKKWFRDLYAIGTDESGGVTRLGYTKNEDVMHGAIRNIARKEGFRYETDEAGNTYISLGEYKEYHVVGSHLDSVISGGRYDGVAGVISGLLILKRLKAEGKSIPVKVAAFRSEESSVFGLATIGSSLITGKITQEKMEKNRNKEGISLYEILKQRGYNPNCKRIEGVKSFLELHIEQGRILEINNLKLGVVNCIAAPTRYWLTIEGRQDHTGATPMNYRLDALCSASEIILKLEELAKSEMHLKTVGTVGLLENAPNAFNVISGKVRLGIDIRGIDKESIQRVADGIEMEIERICKKRNLPYHLELISKEDPVKMDETLQNELIKVIEAKNEEYMIMPSGAGHDAMKFADIAPTAMLFIPCKEGVSHNKQEEIDFEHLLLGTQVIYETLKNIDKNPSL